MEKPSAYISGKGICGGITDLLAVAAFVCPFGIAFGIAAVEKGLTPLQATIMSGLVFTATAQFAALDFVGQPDALLTLWILVLALSGRHVVMGAVLARWVNRLPFGWRFLTLATLSDANFAASQNQLQTGPSDLGPLLGGGLLLWFSWILSTAIGAYGGDVLGDTDALGVGAIMVCFFASTVFGMARKGPRLIPSIGAAMAVSVIAGSVLPDGWGIILAAIIGGFTAVIFDAS